jgi:hypothetical protein
MARGAQTFRQADITRAIKAAVRAGVPVARVEVSPEGRIIVIAGKPREEEQNPTTEANEWDSVK